MPAVRISVSNEITIQSKNVKKCQSFACDKISDLLGWNYRWFKLTSFGWIVGTLSVQC